MSALVRILLVGGGYVTIEAYRAISRRLGSRLRDGNVEVTVLSPNDHHLFHGWTGEVLGGIIRNMHNLTLLRPMLPRARFLRGMAARIDLDRRTVMAKLAENGGAQELAYDHLLLGTGSRDGVESVPGLGEFGWRLKAPDDLRALHAHLHEIFARAGAVTDRAERARLFSVVVAGGGFAGVEMVAAIADLARAVKCHGLRLTLLHSGQELMPQIRPRFNRLANYATRQLHAYGVDLRLGVRLAKVTPAGAVLSDGTTIPAATVIATLGQTFPVLPGTESLLRDELGRILTDAQLHVLGHNNIWVGGDAARVIHPRSGEPCPANALWAMKHGVRAGDNIARAIQGKPPKPFTYPGLGQAAGLGIGKGAVELYGVQVTGWLGWVMRLSFFLWFMPSRLMAIRVLGDWLRLPLVGRQIDSGPNRQLSR